MYFCTNMPAGVMFWICAVGSSATLGLPANVMVLWVLLRSSADSSTSAIFIGSLALIDTIFCVMIPPTIVNYFIWNNVHIWTSVDFFFVFCEYGGTLFLCCVCVDRYLAVLHPITFLRIKDRKYRLTCSVSVWTIILAFSIHFALNKTDYNEQIFTAIFTMAFIVMIFSNLSILRALRQSGPGRDEMHPMKKKAFKVVLSILASVIITYLPAVWICLINKVFPSRVFHCYLKPIAHAFVTMSVSIQPLFYLSVVGKLPCLTNPRLRFATQS
ncbi:GPR4 protein, partial [Atractosteus spatula]|nr:GPR4 protein [Atractosteus spatula]